MHKMTALGVNNRLSTRPIKLALFTLKTANVSDKLLRLVSALNSPFPYAELQNPLSLNPLTAEEVVDLVRVSVGEIEELYHSNGNEQNPYVGYASAVVDYAVAVVSVSGETKPEEINHGLAFCDQRLAAIEGWRHYNA